VLDRRPAADADAGDPRARPARRHDRPARDDGAPAAVIAVFVVASTLAFAIAQRRREFALLRAVGASPRQVQRGIAGEALLRAAIGGAAGCLAELPLAIWIGRGLVDHGIAPSGLRADANWIAPLTAFASGVVIAELALVTAAWRATHAGPAEAPLEAAVEPPGLGLTWHLLVWPRSVARSRGRRGDQARGKDRERKHDIPSARTRASQRGSGRTPTHTAHATPRSGPPPRAKE
jgi:hypothetical protein